MKFGRLIMSWKKNADYQFKTSSLEKENDR